MQMLYKTAKKDVKYIIYSTLKDSENLLKFLCAKDKPKSQHKASVASGLSGNTACKKTGI